MSTEPAVDVSEAVARDETECFFVNKIGRIFYLALEEVASGEPMRAILSSAKLHDRLDHYPPNDFAPEFSFEELGRTQQAMEELYGPSAGRDLARRVGRACFRIGAEDLNPVLGLTDLAFRILPLRMRFKVGLEVLAHLFERFSDHRVRLEEDDLHFAWIVERCGICWDRRSVTPCCNLAVGLLQETVYWLSGGERFYIEEVSCVAAGQPTCTILVGKRPLDRPAPARGER
ncbi:MAG: 4-vinyl reductase [Chloroflexota bacterium]|nr:4-vinyl reductase [Chloroflexota bacterium]